MEKLKRGKRRRGQKSRLELSGTRLHNEIRTWNRVKTNNDVYDGAFIDVKKKARANRRDDKQEMCSMVTNCMEGTGTMNWSDGRVYIGPWKTTSEMEQEAP